MTSMTRIVTGIAVVALSLGFMGCAKLNPKTEGQIVSALDASRHNNAKCYEQTLQSDHQVAADLRLELTFDPKSTKPVSSAVVKTDIKDEKMKKCVSRAAEGIQIEDEPGVQVTGYYTVDFQFTPAAQP